MTTITHAVEEIINADEVALESLRANILNFSAYADQILPHVEKLTHKTVQRGSIVVALHRFSKSVDSMPALRPTVHILDLSIKSPLCELSFDKTASSIESVSQFPGEWYTEGFFTITTGIREISIICSQSMKDSVMQHFSAQPSGSYDSLAAVTLRFNESEYVEQPNMIYTLVSALAGKRVNVIEVVSTFTEISFVVRKSEMNTAISVFQQFFPETE